MSIILGGIKAMAKKIKLELTQAQLLAIIRQTDNLSAMIGSSDMDNDLKHDIKLIDRMLLKNGYKRGI